MDSDIRFLQFWHWSTSDSDIIAFGFQHLSLFISDSHPAAVLTYLPLDLWISGQVFSDLVAHTIPTHIVKAFRFDNLGISDPQPSPFPTISKKSNQKKVQAIRNYSDISPECPFFVPVHGLLDCTGDKRIDGLSPAWSVILNHFTHPLFHANAECINFFAIPLLNSSFFGITWHTISFPSPLTVAERV